MGHSNKRCVKYDVRNPTQGLPAQAKPGSTWQAEGGASDVCRLLENREAGGNNKAQPLLRTWAFVM